MSNSVYIAGAFEHPTREAPDKSAMQLHAEVARGALADAGLPKSRVNGFATAGIPEYKHTFKGPMMMADYLGLRGVSWAENTDDGGGAQLTHMAHAVSAIRDGKCDVVLITLGGRPRSRAQNTGTGGTAGTTMQDNFEHIHGNTVITRYAMVAKRHMHEYGTTPLQFGAIREAVSYHAQFNDDALYPDPVTAQDVVNSRTISDPIHLLDCCVISDGGAAVVLVSSDVADELARECVEIIGCGESITHHDAGRMNILETGARESGDSAFDEAGISRSDVDYASLYDSFTVTVLLELEDLGFCEKGAGGEFAESGALKAPDGELPVNTDGGGLCSNQPANKGGLTKVVEAVRQLRGETAPEVQIPNARYAIAHGMGGDFVTREKHTTLLLEAPR
ncbi:thiolase domain-containing protein [Haloferax sp. MBLA0076]|uniref:Thiolase domain-containing protein n=1 Tax=Haloferax litoreum TaxID=2666140 RepID=A0A6A8GKU8_9EURY|nr:MULTISPECIES: thiolase domain-containing protein [Haloferax]KAB1190427.1 thiolase domain-containing protein [Haloferax sp. CBA1148]MRX23401.1 thiolase domain-containing protein [Haloferax litoreum]